MTITHVQFLPLLGDQGRLAKHPQVLTDQQVARIAPGPRHFQLPTTDVDGHTIGLLEPSDFGAVPR